MSAQSWLNRIWYGPAAPRWLIPLSALYGAVSGMSRYAYGRQWRRSTRLPCPVIVIGNLSVGGTGKTPLVCWLTGKLLEIGHKPGVVTRGYGGSSRGARLAQPTDDPDIVGDEAVLLARRTRVPVAVGRDRPAAARLLLDAGCDVIVSDDGLQHHALARDCEIVVIDGQRGFGNGYLLPAGPLRETPARLREVDAIVVNGLAAAAKPQFAAGALFMQLEPHGLKSLKFGTSKDLRDFSGKSVHAVAAIGNPQRFFDMLRNFGIEVLAHPLPDHVRLRYDDIFFDDERPVFMTEKDAVKCADIAGPQHWYVPISAVFGSRDTQVLLNVVSKAMQIRATRA